MNLQLNDTFCKLLPADAILENYQRQVTGAAFSYVKPKQASAPTLIHVSDEMLSNVGLSIKDSNSKTFLEVFSGNTIYQGTKPYAMAYAGHQFGHWAGQLGDGRAINLFEIRHNQKQWALQLKGSGKTPYSRQGDGLAVLRSSLREYLCSEAMYHLGVPTTRSLALMLSGDEVLRDVLYDGNASYEKGAILTRVAPSFIRFGNFELFAARKDHDNLKRLTDYTIAQFYPELGMPSKETYIKFFQKVSEKTLEMIIHWQRVGFVHGVMNTDNMSILGLTIDYGPYGWLEGFDFNWTPNTTDSQNKRYRYGNQPNIALWNLMQLANAIYPLIQDVEPLEAVLEEFKINYEHASLQMMRSKLGLQKNDENDVKLIADLEDCLQLVETDMTLFFRLLSNFNKENPNAGLSVISKSFYTLEDLIDGIKKQWTQWFNNYSKRLYFETIPDDERRTAMNLVNPKYVLRNYMAQLAIDDANTHNYELLDELFQLLKNPYSEQPKYEKWFAKRPEWARHKVGCSMLSCSS